LSSQPPITSGICSRIEKPLNRMTPEEIQKLLREGKHAELEAEIERRKREIIDIDSVKRLADILARRFDYTRYTDEQMARERFAYSPRTRQLASFGFPDGMRLTITREIVRDSPIYVSASCNYEVEKDQFAKAVQERWERLGRGPLRELNETEVQEARAQQVIEDDFLYFIEEPISDT
jgi:hypothetical protein